MTMFRLIRRSLASSLASSLSLGALALTTIAPLAHSQRGRVQQSQSRGQEVFEWSGRIDRGIRISMRGAQLDTRDLGGTETGRARSQVMMSLPRQSGQLYVQVLNGRGTASVVEQPSARNGYAAVVDVVDPGVGADDYRVAGYWQSYTTGDVYSNDRNDRNNRNDRNDRNDRDNRDNRDRNGRYGRGTSRDRNDGYDNRAGNTNANGRQNMLHWSGNVDGEVELRIQNGRIDYRIVSGMQPTSVRADRSNALIPRGAAQVGVIRNEGRGSVTVIQQPSNYNGYATVLRIRDPQGGYGFYDFDLIWE